MTSLHWMRWHKYSLELCIFMAAVQMIRSELELKQQCMTYTWKAMLMEIIRNHQIQVFSYCFKIFKKWLLWLWYINVTGDLINVMISWLNVTFTLQASPGPRRTWFTVKATTGYCVKWLAFWENTPMHMKGTTTDVVFSYRKMYIISVQHTIELSHRIWVPHICVSKLGHQWCRWWFDRRLNGGLLVIG